MLKLTVLGTGSKGNSYILDTGTEQLILDAGVSSKEVKTVLNWNITGIKGVVCSHRHIDHAKYIPDYTRMGIDVWTPYKCDNMKRTKRFGSFKVTSFPVPHDDVPCVGYIVEVNGIMLLYATDYEYIPFRFDHFPINTFLIETNYCESVINRDEEKFSHVVRGHASLSTAEDFVRSSKSDSLRNIILCHLSDDNSDEREILSGIKSCVDDTVAVRIADAGLVVELN